jgi:hypothetical protein
MEAKALPNELAKLTSSTNRLVYRLFKATAMSLAIGFIASLKAGYCLFLLLLTIDSIEDSFLKCYRQRGLRVSLISLLCILIVAISICFVVQRFFYGYKEIALFAAWLCLLMGSTFMEVVASIKRPKEAV